MRVAKRICAFALALTIAFLSVGYEPPKANAVVTEVVGTSALATSALASYMTATGVPLTVISGGAAAASAGTASLVSGYAAATGATYEVVTTAIAAGATISGGTIILGAAAVAVLAAIVAWAVDHYSVNSDSPIDIYDNTSGYVFGDGDVLRFNPKMTDKFADWDGYTLFEGGKTYTFASGFVFDGAYTEDGVRKLRIYSASQSRWIVYQAINYNWAYAGLVDTGSGDYVVYFFNSEGGSIASYNGIGRTHFAESAEVEIQTVDNYVPLPEMAGDSSLLIHTGIASETLPEEMPSAIFSTIAGGEFAPTYEEQSETNPNPDEGSTTNPDDGTEDEPSTGTDLSGVLGWLEAIWNAIKSLVEAIGDKLMQLFVPSEEYMEALPEALTDAFAERTGFLTYPMSLLFGFVDLIATPAGDFILEWDDVYEPFSRGKLISAGQFNVTQYVNSNQALSNVYSLWKTVVSGYLIFMFFDLCYKKYNAIVRDRLG